MRGVENPRPYRPAKPNAAFDKDIVAILHALSSSEMEPSLRWCIEFALLTGLRSGECRKAEWTHVDWDRRHLNLPSLNVKTDEVFRVHLSDASLKVLKAVKDYYGASRYVFPGRGEGKMLGATSMAQAMQRKHEQGAVEKYFKPHDLRKTFRTMLLPPALSHRDEVT